MHRAFGLFTVIILSLLPTVFADAEPRFARVAWGGHGYHLSFEVANDSVDPPRVAWFSGQESGNATPIRVLGPPDDDDAMYLAELPGRALQYALGGQEAALAAPPSATERVRVAFLADMGRGAQAKAVWAAIERAAPSMVIIGGDISYAHGRSAVWDEWFALVSPLASRIPVMVAFGNHESYCQTDGPDVQPCLREVQEYLEHFHMPNAPKRYYDFDWGPAHFVAIDTETYEPREGVPQTNASEQIEFATASLSATDAPWKIAFFHRPLYSTTRGGEKESAEARTALEPILDAGGVDLVLTGHAHAYERSWPLRGGEVVRQTAEIEQGEGWVHLVSGGGGRSLYAAFGPEAPWSATRAAQYHFLLLDISPERIVARAIGPDDSLIDEFAVTRTAGAPPAGPTSIIPTPAVDAPPASSEATGSALTPGVGLLVLLVLALVAVVRRGR